MFSFSDSHLQCSKFKHMLGTCGGGEGKGKIEKDGKSSEKSEYILR